MTRGCRERGARSTQYDNEKRTDPFFRVVERWSKSRSKRQEAEGEGADWKRVASGAAKHETRISKSETNPKCETRSEGRLEKSGRAGSWKVEGGDCLDNCYND